MGDSVATPIAIPSLAMPGKTYSGSILRPADTTSYPGRRPIAALAHGAGGNRCALFWAAQTLAGHGYIALIWSAPGNSTAVQFARGADAQRSAVEFARSSANPYLNRTDGNRVALVGYSLGAGVTSLNQEADDDRIRAAVFFDNLRHYRTGDPGGVDYDCGKPPSGEVKPRVPAIGFAKDETCAGDPESPPSLKQAGFRHWKSKGLATMEIVMRGFVHEDFGSGGSAAGWHDLSHYTLAWLDRWVRGDAKANRRLLSEEVNGRRATAVFSETFTSGIFLPSFLSTPDLGRMLERDAGPPNTSRKSRPRSETTRRALRRHPLKFGFGTPQAGVTFECRIDGKPWKRCKSPRRIRRTGLGRHVFRVRATDPGGLREKKAAKWVFRVVRRR